MNFPNGAGGFNPIMNQGMMQGNPNLMMNLNLLQQQQLMMNNMIMRNQFMQGQQPNMFAQSNIQQQFNQNMLQQQQIMNSNMNYKNPNYITVFFQLQIRNGPDINPFTIQCSLDDKVSSVIQQFRNKAQDFDILHEKFIFNAKRLNETLTVAESGITNNSIIYVINDKDLEGGF